MRSSASVALESTISARGIPARMGCEGGRANGGYFLCFIAIHNSRTTATKPPMATASTMVIMSPMSFLSAGGIIGLKVKGMEKAGGASKLLDT